MLYIYPGMCMPYNQSLLGFYFVICLLFNQYLSIMTFYQYIEYLRHFIFMIGSFIGKQFIRLANVILNHSKFISPYFT